MALHEYRQDLQYSLLHETGMEHEKVFTMCVTIDGEQYEGCGPTKQKAKYNAAKAAKRKTLLLTVSSTRGVGRLSRRPSTTPPRLPSGRRYYWRWAVRGLWADKAEGQVQRRQGCQAEDVTIDGEQYEGRGPTKRKAKCNAAKAAKRKTLLLTVSSTRGVGRQSRRPSTTPPRLASGRRYYWRWAVRGAWADKAEGQVQRRQGCQAEDVTIYGEQYEGRGPTKQKAKYNAAKAAKRKTLLLRVSSTRGVGRQSRRPSTTPPRLPSGRRYYWRWAVRGVWAD